jgi:hypothetical protein
MPNDETPTAKVVPLKTGIEHAAISDAEAAGHFIANALSRWHLNGWVALGIAIAANILGVTLHV